MIVPTRVRRRYEKAKPHIDAVAAAVRNTVLGYCDQQGYAYVGRVKTLESLAEKIETGRFSRWSEVDDLFGCAVVIPTLAEERPTLEFLESVFTQVAIKKRGTTQKRPDSFRFDATRFYGRLKSYESDTADPREQITFEVQVRSAFEHAWSVTTHHIYKSKSVDWKAERLAAQLKAAVEQLDSLVLAADLSSQTIVEHTWPELTAKRNMVDRLSRLVSEGVVPETLAPKDWSRFADNLLSLVGASGKAPKGGQERGRFTTEAFTKLEAELRAVGAAKLPLSLSFLEVGFGMLVQLGMIAPPLYRFCPLVTDDLLGFFPCVEPFRLTSFDLEN
ncbi:RelA/SpoT domain-containing protein [bacterium]|nr:RelA/SpoT domain-containing protein [bacterium]